MSDKNKIIEVRVYDTDVMFGIHKPTMTIVSDDADEVINVLDNMFPLKEEKK